MSTKKQQQLNILIAKRDQYFSRVQRLYDCSKKVDNDRDINTFFVRYESLEETKLLFLEVIDEINKLQYEIDIDFKPDYNVLNSFDELYCYIQFTAKKLNAKENNAQSETESKVIKSTPKLPKLELPNFSGDIKEWPLFYECFQSLIHENKSLDDIDKVHFLVGKLSGKALAVCSGIPPVADNYKIIWQALIDKYQDKRALASSYLEQIINFKPAQTESAYSLNNFLEKFDTATRALQKLDISDLSDFILSYVALSKLDPETIRLFENTHRDSSMPTYKEIIDFVKEQAKICARTRKSNNSGPSKSFPNNPSKNASTSFVVQDQQSNDFKNCPLCNTDAHTLSRCIKFLDVAPTERYKIVKDKNLCLNCLGRHRICNCKSKSTCSICKVRHHTLLHFERSSLRNANPYNNSNHFPKMQNKSSVHDNSNNSAECSKNSSVVEEIPTNTLSLCSVSRSSYKCQYTVLLSTAIVNIVTENGERHMVRFLLDSASQAHFLTLDCCKRLKLPYMKYHSTVSGIGLTSNSVCGRSSIVVASCFDPTKQYCLDVLLVNKITDKLPQSVVLAKSLTHLIGLPLADSTFYRPGEIDGIIGAELFSYLLGSKRVNGPSNTPVAVETTLGYVVMGTAPLASTETNIQSFCTILELPSIENLVQKFWEIEEISTINNYPSPEDIECENHFKSTYKRDVTDGRYTVSLPFKDNVDNLGDSYSIAYRRFLSLERKLNASADFRKQYNNVIQDYIDQGHMRKIVEYSVPVAYYIPHHGIFKAHSTSTPLRIVFDASAKTDASVSLNDILHTGPKLQTDVLNLFLNFRLYEIAFTADIKQMYRQINLCDAHKRFQRILWRFTSDEALETYELTTVAFGVKSSPFLALRTIRQLALDEAKRYPLASAVALRDMYVDDIVCSVSDLSKAKLVYYQLVNLFKAGGFSLVKWSVNSKELLEQIPEENRLSQVVNFEVDCLKVLGIQWYPNTDILSFNINVQNRVCSKRNVLSTVAKFFDPLGLIAPVILFAKLFIKKLWILRLDWDDTPPQNLVKQWLEFQKELVLLEKFAIPRHVGYFENSTAILIGFADACETSYGAVVYLRTSTSGKGINVSLVCAKTKVAPLKVISIPRLELCAAHLLSKLMNFVVTNYSDRIKIENLFAFSDSTVTLNWIHSSPHKWKTFVANRVAKIQELVPSKHWHYIMGEMNPSDLLSRGSMPSRFLDSTQWVTGTPWLKLDISQWPIKPFSNEDCVLLEEKTVSLAVSQTNEHPLYTLINRCSSWLKLLRATVYVLRFLKILPKMLHITATDLEKAEHVLLKVVQKKHFSFEIASLEKDEIISTNLRKLRPFLNDGIVRVGGRLRNADLNFDTRYPILLPKRDNLVTLLIEHYHRSNLHTGPHLVLSLLRQRYWILAARGVIRNCIQKCNVCFKARPKSQYPIMGDLPSCRVQQTKAFLFTGVDYAGPLNITISRHRGVRSQKAYICLFVCLVTKAIHLELVSDLSTANFLQAFKRFLARRGLCSVIYSDCGTNFIGAKATLDELYRFLISKEYNNEILKELAARKIEWKLNPPSAPHFGGIWEANIKSVKTHLYKVVGHQILSYEELSTLLVQIEALLNSRPLCVLSSDPSEPLALTPSHFLTLTPLTQLPSYDFTDVSISRLSRFQMIDKMVQDFWNRWRVEYLTSLQPRERWNTPSFPIKLGTVVLVEQASIPPLQWPLGLIIKVFPGKDGIVRVVSVKTKQGVFKRPVVKVYPLPTQ